MMPVYLSQNAYDQLQDIVSYLENNWSEKIRDNFLSKLDTIFETISTFPYSFPESNAMLGLRKCVVSNQVTAFYRVDEVRKEIEIMAVLDNRQMRNF